MKVKDHSEGKLIIFSKALDSSGKILYLIYFLMFLTGAVFLSLLTTLDSAGRMADIVGIGTGLIFFLAAYRFGNKAFFTDKMVISKNTIRHIQRGFTGTTHTYQIANISNLRHLDKPELTKHPLAGETFDYMGFQTEQKVINEMHGDNRVAFDYNGLTITFGENIYSWDFGELEMILYEITGNDLRYTDDFEKKTFPSNT